MKDELFHHGIDGQKWGVRHGPPYPLDREDHNKVVERSKNASKKRHLSYGGSGRYAKQMTDKDLNDTIDRLQREETYRRLVSKEKEEKKAAKLSKKAKKEADERLKIQNENTKRQQDLQEEQLKQQKKANGIVHKVIENLLTNAASTAGNLVTKHLIEQGFNKPKNEDKNNESNTDNKPNDENNNNKPKLTSPKLEKLDKQREKLQKELANLNEQKPTATNKQTLPLTLPNVTTDHINPNDIPTMSEAQINQALIQAFNGVYLSDESEGACL